MLTAEEEKARDLNVLKEYALKIKFGIDGQGGKLVIHAPKKDHPVLQSAIARMVSDEQAFAIESQEDKLVVTAPDYRQVHGNGQQRFLLARAAMNQLEKAMAEAGVEYPGAQSRLGQTIGV